jgi:hypothetical protein
MSRDKKTKKNIHEDEAICEYETSHLQEVDSFRGINQS